MFRTELLIIFAEKKFKIIKMNAGEKIKTLLAEQRMTQKALADTIGIHPVVVNRLTKKASFDAQMLGDIAKAFHVPVAYFYDEAISGVVMPCEICREKEKVIVTQQEVIRLLKEQLDIYCKIVRKSESKVEG